MDRKIATAMLAVAAWLFSQTQLAKANETPTLTLADALALVDAKHPGVAAANAAVVAAAAGVTQAGLFPNPGLQLESEDIAGSGAYSGLGAGQWTLSVAQAIPLGGDRQAAVDLAVADQGIAGAAAVAARFQARRTVASAYADLWSAEASLSALDRLLESATQAVAATERRASAGAANDADIARVRIELAKIDLERLRAGAAIVAAGTKLRTQLGLATTPAVAAAAPSIPNLPGDDDIDRLNEAPAVRRAAFALESAHAAERRAVAAAIPDLEVSLGGRTYGDTGDAAIVAGVAIPLPLFDRGQGTRPQARALAESARFDAAAVAAALRSEVAEILARARTATAELDRLHSDVLPQAEKAIASAQSLYERGLFSALELLDAQRTLQDMRLREIATSAELIRAVADLEVALGAELLVPREPAKTPDIRP